MSVRVKDLVERRETLVAESAIERERAARCGEHIAHLFSKDNLARAMKSSAGTVAGWLILRWIGRKVAGKIGSLLERQATRMASGFRRRH